MAGKLLKHFGFGGKKTPPQPPNKDYSGLKSASTESSLARSPTNERTSGNFSAASSHIGDFEVTQLSGSPQRLVGTEKGAFGGARPKETGDGCTDARSPLVSASSCDDAEVGASSEAGEAPKGGPSATPPRLLDEYSDPVDLKKQIQEAESLLGPCAEPIVEDDYSVPYEVKKLFKEMRLRGEQDSPSKARNKLPHEYDDPYEESDGSLYLPLNHGGTETTDLRPQQDYDEPWEWSAKQSVLLQSQLENTNHNLPPHFMSKTNATPQLKRTSDEKDSPDGATTSVVESEDVAEPPAEESLYEPATSNHHDPGSDEEGYTHLREEFTGRPKPPTSSADDAAKSDASPVPSSSQPAKPAGGTIGNYEEPWDLASKQIEIEDKLKAASDRASRDNQPPPHESDTREQEGYEKPWDWKPHQKDDRNQEGYEKPWDWKPHQKDDRPGEEYEEPWDQKAKHIDTDLLIPKQPTPSAQGKDVRREEDTRPPEEYDEPWDSKVKKSQSRGGSSSDSSPKSAASPGGSSPHQGPSPKKKQHKLNLDLGTHAWNVRGERVDPQIPLEQQGWYHGSISRVDAENLLRVHKEGSYLIRMSESNKLDYSLSLKSARGFMHMKIVSRDKRFILGQFSQPFDTIPQMIHHYSLNKLPIKELSNLAIQEHSNNNENKYRDHTTPSGDAENRSADQDKMADSWLDTVEDRLDILEQQVFGQSDKEVAYPKVIDTLVNINSNVNAAVSGKKKIESVMQKLGQLELLLDPAFTDRLTSSQDAKMEIILSEEELVRQQAANLEKVEKMLNLLNSEHIKAVGDEIGDGVVPTLQGRLHELSQMHIQQQDEVNRLTEQTKELLLYYNNVISLLSKQFIYWDGIITQMEAAKQIKSQQE